MSIADTPRPPHRRARLPPASAADACATWAPRLARFVERHRPYRRRHGAPRLPSVIKKYGNGEGSWVAAFHRDVMLSADGFGSGPTPWQAVQRAAWRVVKRPN